MHEVTHEFVQKVLYILKERQDGLVDWLQANDRTVQGSTPLAVQKFLPVLKINYFLRISVIAGNFVISKG